ncbi:hypothetical protein SDC9_163811 [bioreactor metagenome]|uniref:Uncharacterized protein n=1 Tax=bioreactor metagenome TaxID=1076179 RepID=A0A645FPW2_9ZZZZ
MEPGTLSGNLIVNLCVIAQRYISVVVKAIKIPVKIALAPSSDIGITFNTTSPAWVVTEIGKVIK